MIWPLTPEVEQAIVAEIPQHAPGDICFTALEMAQMYATLHAERRRVQMAVEVLRECLPFLEGSTFGLKLKIENILNKVE